MASNKSRKTLQSSKPSESSIFIFTINCQVKVASRSLDLRYATTREGIAYAMKRCDMPKQSCFDSYNFHVVTRMYYHELSFKLKLTTLYQPTHWDFVKADWHNIASWSRSSSRYLIRFPNGHWQHDHLGILIPFHSFSFLENRFPFSNTSFHLKSTKETRATLLCSSSKSYTFF